MKKLLLLLLPLFLFSNDFEEFKKKEQKSFSSFKKDLYTYEKVFKKAYESYLIEISQFWPQKETSNKNKWVQYSKNYQEKNVVDYQKQTIILNVIAKTKEQARKKLAKSLDVLLKEDVTSAHNKDQISIEIQKKLKENKPVLSKEKIIADVLETKTIKEYEKSIKNKTLKKRVFKNKNIYSLKLKMPKQALIKKAQLHKNDINNNAKLMHLPKELIYAIIHSESAFNPMARSHIPAFGLMQIVPKSAGIDSYNFLYGEKKLLNAQYLYQASNNIMIGSTYLHILYYRYLKKIKDPKSRLYCTIAAYNTGSGNITKAFNKERNTNKAIAYINTLNAEEVYQHLIKKLPYKETRKYLPKVTKRLGIYKRLIKNNIL